MLMYSGGWSKLRKVEKKDLDILHKALKGFVGSGFDDPLVVSTQVVAGTNYRFLCDARLTIGPDAGDPNYLALVEVFQPLEGDPHLTRVEKIG